MADDDVDKEMERALGISDTSDSDTDEPSTLSNPDPIRPVETYPPTLEGMGRWGVQVNEVLDIMEDRLGSLERRNLLIGGAIAVLGLGAIIQVNLVTKVLKSLAIVGEQLKQLGVLPGEAIYQEVEAVKGANGTAPIPEKPPVNQYGVVDESLTPPPGSVVGEGVDPGVKELPEDVRAALERDQAYVQTVKDEPNPT